MILIGLIVWGGVTNHYLVSLFLILHMLLVSRAADKRKARFMKLLEDKPQEILRDMEKELNRVRSMIRELQASKKDT
jgi:hypothetical protein